MSDITYHPPNWKIVPFEDLYSEPSKNGVSRPTKIRGSGYKMVNMGELFAHDRINDQEMALVPMTKKELIRYGLQKGDLLFARRSIVVEGAGKCSIVESITSPTTYEGSIIRVRLDSSIADPEFYYHFISSEYGIYKMRSIVMCLAAAGIRGSELAKIKMPLPPLPEQRKIAEILSTWESAIELMEQQIESKQRLKKGLMKQLLPGKLRFPGFDSEWQLVTLGDIFFERNENDSSLDLLSITGDKGIIPRDELGRKDTSSDDKSNYKVIMPGDIGYNTMRMWQGRSSVSRLKGIVSPAYTVVTPKKNHDVDFYGYLFQLPKIIHLFYRYSQGLVSDTWNLKFPHFSQIKIDVPGYDEQKRIAEALLKLDEEIEILNNRTSAFERQKRGLMQKLLTGEVRVKV